MARKKAEKVEEQGAKGVRVSYPPYDKTFPGFVGKTVTAVLKELRGPWSIGKSPAAKVNREEVKPSHRLKEGDHLQFVRPAGRKG